MSDTGAKAKIKVKFKINVEYAFQIFLRLSHFMHICQTTPKYLIAVPLMVKRQQPFSQRFIRHRHWHYGISTEATNVTNQSLTMTSI